MANKEIGSLLVKMLGNSQSLVKSINNTVNSLSNLAQGLEKINKISLSGITDKFTTLATAINKFASSVDESSLSRFRSLSNSLYQIGNTMARIQAINLDTLNQNFLGLASAIEPFLNKLKESESLINSFGKAVEVGDTLAKLKLVEAQTSLINERISTEKVRRDKINAQLKLTEERLKKLTYQQGKLNKRTTFWDNLWKVGKFDYFIRTLKRFARGLGNLFTNGADFNETLNKFQSATNEYYRDAITFARQLAESFGLAEETVMNYQSTFVNMLGSLQGLENDTANKLGQSLTIMALDYASLFNTTIESAMSAFQSVLSGRTTAIRSASGIDVTQNTIYEYYKQLGGQKSLNSLSQLEKRLLRILAVYDQMNEAVALGDMAETLDSFSNQARILSEQLKEVGVWFSNIFIGGLEEIMPLVNGIVISTKEILKSLAYMVGYTQQSVKGGLIDTLNAGAEDFDTNMGNANEKLKETLGLLSFDKFNVLNQGTATSAIGGDVQLILDALQERTKTLQDAMSKVESSASNIANSILDWLGYTDTVVQTLEPILDSDGKIIDKLVDERTIKVLKETYTNLEKILNAIFSLASTIGIVKLIPLVKKLSEAMNTANASTQLLANSMQILQNTGIFLLIYSLMTLVTQWKDLDDGARAFYIVLGVLGASMIIFSQITKIVNSELTFMEQALKLCKLASNTLSVALSVGIIVGVIALISQLDNFSSSARGWVGAIGLIAGALLGVAVAIMAIKQASLSAIMPVALASIGAFAVGITALVKNASIPQYAEGGFPAQGEIFVARERGPELVGSMGGKTTVANNYQIEQGIEEASYRGFMRAMSQNQTSNKLVIEGKNINDSALIRALMPAIKQETSRIGGR